MNIVIITPIYFIKDRNNLFHDSSAVHYLVKPWANEHNVTVIHIYSQSFGKINRYCSKQERKYYKYGYHFSADGVDVHMCETQRFYKQLAILNSVQGKRVMKFVYSVMKKKGLVPDVIVSHMPTTSMYVLEHIFHGIPKIAVLHTTDVLNSQMYSSMLSKIDRVFDATYTRSKTIYNFFDAKLLSTLKDEIVYSGAPVSVNNPRILTKPIEFSILYVGRLIVRKNVDKIILALSYFVDKVPFKLNIYGEGEEYNKLQALAKEKLQDGKVNFVGVVPHESILEIMETSDIFVMPSKGETLGLVYLEAMAKSNIVIGSRGEGIDGIIKNRFNGFLVNPDSVEDLRDTFEYIFNMRENEFQDMSSNAYRTACEFDEDKMGRKYLNLIKKNSKMF